MKTTKLVSALLLASATLPFFTSCDPKQGNIDTPTISTGVFVLNEGQYGKNNSSVTYYDFSTSFPSSDIFMEKNNRGLGDTGQDMIKYGSNLYIAVSGSNVLEVLDAKSGISKKQITVSSPRSLSAANGKVYIVLFDGHVTQLDTTSLTLGTSIAVGSNPEGSVISNNKLYVANSGGLAMINDSTVSVIDLSTFIESKKIKVNLNPVLVKADANGDVYVVSRGNYYDIPGKFQRIEAGTDKVTDTNVKAQNFSISGDVAYIYNFEYDANWQVVNNTIATYDVKNEKLLNANFISDINKTPYCIAADPTNNDIYLGVTDYITNGKMFCYDSTGKLKFSFTTGISPSKVVFITK